MVLYDEPPYVTVLRGNGTEIDPWLCVYTRSWDNPNAASLFCFGAAWSRNTIAQTHLIQIRVTSAAAGVIVGVTMPGTVSNVGGESTSYPGVPKHTTTATTELILWQLDKWVQYAKTAAPSGPVDSTQYWPWSITLSNYGAADDFQLYAVMSIWIKGSAPETIDPGPAPVIVEKIHEWPWVRGS